MKIKNPLYRMIVYSLIGAAAGLISGFIFGLLINLITFALHMPGMPGGVSLFFPGVFFGMGLGTLVGGILGGIVAIKKIK